MHRYATGDVKDVQMDMCQVNDIQSLNTDVTTYSYLADIADITRMYIAVLFVLLIGISSLMTSLQATF